MWSLQVLLVFLASTLAFQLYGPPKDASLFERPFQVAIFKNEIFRCSGSIISNNCVLTACSCIVGKTYPGIASSSTSLSDSYMLVSYTRYLKTEQLHSVDVTDAFIADGCNPVNNENDAAILCSREEVVGYATSIVKEETSKNVRGIVSGWGLSVKGENLVSNDLKRAYMKIISLEECRRRYAGVRNVPDSALCAVAVDEVRGFCAGDIGGPLTHGEGQIGISVADFGCEKHKYPGIFTNVSRISQYIENVLRDYEFQLEMGY